MTQIVWDQVGERVYETGVDHGVLYRQDVAGAYSNGYAWNGLTSFTESPSGAEATPQYADNIKYLNLVSAEEFGGTLEAFTYPDEFAECDGSASPVAGISVGQQTRKPFGLAYRTLKGNDVEGTDYGYKLHLIYGALAAPSEKAYNTVNDAPEAITFSWELTTTGVAVPGLKPSASITLDSTKVDAEALETLEQILYGTAGVDPRLPLPAEVIALFSGTVTEVTPTEPTAVGNVITIPTVTGVTYTINGEAVTGTFTMTALTGDVVVEARPNSGYKFPEVTDDDWYFNHTP